MTATENKLSGPPIGLLFSPQQLQQMQGYLREVYYEAEARCVVLADITGQLIAQEGNPKEVDTTVLSALAAGNLAATREMARLVGEPARFKLLLHEGDLRTVYLSDVDDELILVIVCPSATPLGLVRLVIREAIAKIQPIVQEARHRPTASAPGMDDEFTALLDSELEALI